MTLLVAWTGIDSRSPASVYIATDSRVSWGAKAVFDYASKTFAFTRFPAVIGYCGDSLASQMLISQVTALIEGISDYSDKRLNNIVNIFCRLIARNYTHYPVKGSTGNFTVVVCGKAAIDSAGDFECYRINSDFQTATTVQQPFPNASGPLVISGSGKNDFEEIYKNHQASNNPNKTTSRDVFHAFHKAITRGSNPTVGPIPQIVTVRRKPYSGGLHCGVVIKGKRYISGQLVDMDVVPRGLQWFNEDFEITNPLTRRRQVEAQVQPPFRG